ncbi:MAG TPA: hypothetical protein VFC63_00550, partial [Blastocatellia bacterium]|nr:hypothetical protein [Blastocatellia bacterium]
GLFTLSRNSRPERLRDFILLVLIVSAGTEFYLWLWTVAADLDLTTPHRAVRRLYQIGNDYTLGNDLVFWRDSLLIQIPVWLAAMAILFHYLKSILEKRFSALILGMVYVMLTLGTVLLFRPDPYSSFSILSWWPLLFSFSVVCCGIVSLLALRRFWSTAEVTQ